MATNQMGSSEMSLAMVAAILFLGSTAVTAAASAFLFLPSRIQQHLHPILVSFAAGALLATAFLVILPDTIRQIGPHRSMSWTLGGVLLFFLLERLVLFRHNHDEISAATRAAGTIVLSGDAIHSFFDGVIIGAAFQYSTELGIATSLGILIHEIPQEVSDFAVLVSSGKSRSQALLLNYLAALPAVIGGILTFYFLGALRHVLPFFMAVSASSLIYVSIADLVPGLHRYTGWRAGALQLIFILIGVGTIALVRVP